MPQHTVDRLKELLFERENREIGTLTQRLDNIAQRAGGDEELRRSVARVIDGALKDAEETKHRELNQALAPVIQRTFRQEIRSPETQSELENALYPKLGVMVQRYIASAMRDMMENINRRLEGGLTQNRLALKIRSVATGRSMAELALADTQAFTVEEIYLIRRGSGELVHRWSHEPLGDAATGASGSNRDTLISGFLTAITGFAEDAFAGDKSMLRSLDLDAHRIYLRASPAYLVAAKTSGSAEASIEEVLDTNLIDILKAHQAIEAKFPPDGGQDARSRAVREHQFALTQSSQSLESAISEAGAEIKKSRGSMRPLKSLLGLIGLSLAGYLGWQYYIRMITAEMQAHAETIVKGAPNVAGYPVSVRVDPGARAITVNGLVPDTHARDHITRELAKLAPDARLYTAIGVLPQADVETAVEVKTVRNAANSAQRRIERAMLEVERIGPQLPVSAQAEVDAARQGLGQAASGIGAIQQDPIASDLVAKLQDAIRALHEAHSRVTALAGAAVAAPATPALPRNAAEALDELAQIAERVAGAAGRLDQIARQARIIAPLEQQNAKLQSDIAALTTQLAALQPTARDRLLTYARSHAVFFSNATDYRDPAGARSVLDQLAQLALATDGLVRVVGYTDEAGSPQRNQQLSQQRADYVSDELAARGIPRRRLLSVGRATNMDLVPRTGTSSSNRRVEFEIGFDGEEPGSP